MEGSLIGHVVTVLYPYTDLSGVKRRPAVVLAQLNDEEVLLCQIASQPQLFQHGIQLRKEHFESGGLSHDSQIRCDRLISVHHSIITNSAGILDPTYFKVVKNTVIALIQSE